MDAKVTLSFNEQVIESAKQYAAERGISMSRLVEYLLRKVTTQSYSSLEDFPISDWVNEVAEGKAVYKTKTKSSKDLRDEFYSSKKQ
jgi:antitoxin component of RelBE/YafQ-DinJ toxin-antitoxin module